VISDITSLTGYYALGERLRARHFSEDSTSEVICRWRHRDTGLILDVMPDDAEIRGFSTLGMSTRSRPRSNARCLMEPRFA
jgi:hypothetical protein